MATRIYIVEDHCLMRQVLREMIDKVPGLEVCGVAASAEEALAGLNGAEVDVALIDISLPQMSGAELVAVLRARWPALRCLILSGHNEASYVKHGLAAGAQGYILKGNPAELQEGIASVLAGNRYLSEPLRPSDQNVHTG
jgi:DNA-binding NarL/FixJ family response regulator